MGEFDDRYDASPRQISIRCAPVATPPPMATKAEETPWHDQPFSAVVTLLATLASDRPLLADMAAAGGSASFSDLATRIVTSRQFRHRAGDAALPSDSASLAVGAPMRQPIEHPPAHRRVERTVRGHDA